MIRQAYFYEGEDHIDDEYIKTIARRKRFWVFLLYKLSIQSSSIC